MLEVFLQVLGDLTIKDITKNIVLNVERPDSALPKNLSLVASTLINRNDFKLDLGFILEVGEILLSDTIQIIMDIKLIKEN